MKVDDRGKVEDKVTKSKKVKELKGQGHCRWILKSRRIRCSRGKKTHSDLEPIPSILMKAEDPQKKSKGYH